MPFVEQRPNGTWRARWRDSDGRKHSKDGLATRAAAMRVAGQQEYAARKAGSDVAAGKSPTWGDWCARWLAVRKVEPSTAEADRMRIERYLQPRWGHVRLAKITRPDVQAWVNELTVTDSARGTPLSGASVRLIFRLFSKSMREAVRDGVLDSSPCTQIVQPMRAEGVERFLTRAEVDAIVHYLHAGPRMSTIYRAAIVVLSETGLRFGELAGLHWWRVDLEHGLLHVQEVWDTRAGRIKGYPKSQRGRAVPLSDRALAAFDALRPITSTGRSSCGLPHSVGRCRSPLVFTTTAGTPLDANNFRERNWAAACQRAGVHDARLHDLRHTYASWLVQNGVPIQEVARLLGHSSVVVAERYARLSTSQHTLVLAALNRPAARDAAWDAARGAARALR